MKIKVKAEGPKLTGKTYTLDKISELLETLGFVPLDTISEDHGIVFYRPNDYHSLQGSANK